MTARQRIRCAARLIFCPRLRKPCRVGQKAQLAAIVAANAQASRLIRTDKTKQ